MANGAVKTAAGNPTGAYWIRAVVVVNGVTIKDKTSTSSWADCDTFTEKDSNTITVTWTTNSPTNVGFSSSSHKSGGSPACHVSVQQKSCSGSVRTANSPQGCNLDYNLPRTSGLVNGNPIYLERLTQLSTNTSHITKNSLK